MKNGAQVSWACADIWVYSYIVVGPGVFGARTLSRGFDLEEAGQ
jgi:hypothetical protein